MSIFCIGKPVGYEQHTKEIYTNNVAGMHDPCGNTEQRLGQEGGGLLGPIRKVRKPNNGRVDRIAPVLYIQSEMLSVKAILEQDDTDVD